MISYKSSSNFMDLTSADVQSGEELVWFPGDGVTLVLCLVLVDAGAPDPFCFLVEERVSGTREVPKNLTGFLFSSSQSFLPAHWGFSKGLR